MLQANAKLAQKGTWTWNQRIAIGLGSILIGDNILLLFLGSKASNANNDIIANFVWFVKYFISQWHISMQLPGSATIRLVILDMLFEFFRIEFYMFYKNYRISRFLVFFSFSRIQKLVIYRICRKLFLITFIFKTNKK